MLKYFMICLMILFYNQILFSQGVMFRRIMIDPGHGGIKTGTLGYNGSDYPDEKDINLDVGLYLRDMLLNQLAYVEMIRTEDVHIHNSIRQRTINEQKPEAMISIHFNGDNNKAIQGTETWWYKNTGLANNVHSELLKQGYRDRGVKKKGWTVLVVDSVVAASLCEPLYLTELEGWQKMTFGIIGIQEVATYINNGLVHYFDGVVLPWSTFYIGAITWDTSTLPYLSTWGFTWVNDNKKATYTVYSTDDPYLPIDQWSTEVENIIETSFEDTIVDNSKFYCVEMNDNDSLTYSEKLGYIKQICETTSGKDLNLISMPLLDADYEFVSDLSAKYQDRIESVSKWDAVNQCWLTASNTFLGWIDDFEVEDNAVYMINITDYVEFLSSGIIYEQDQYYLRNNENGNNNFITVPLNKDSLNTTELFGNDIGTCNSVSKWIASSQSWETSEYSSNWSNIFSTVIGLPYVLGITENTYYPQSKESNYLSNSLQSKDINNINTPKKIIFHIVDYLGNELTDINDITFEVYIKSRPSEIQISSSNVNTKVDSLNNMLYVETNVGNFDTEWADSEILHFEVTQTSTGYKGRGDVILDNTANALVKGYEAISPGTGNPIKLTEFGSSSPIITSIEKQTNDVTIKWHPLLGATTYDVYSSADPYNNFLEDLSGSLNDTVWTAPLDIMKKFFYVIGVNGDKRSKNDINNK